MDLAFFSFIRLEEGSAENHRAYNRWHQLDHRPENLALPGVAWGDRWARGPECREAGSGAAPFDETDYVAMYWFRSPTDEAVRAWSQLGEDSFQWGRGPLIPGVQRDLLGFFRPVKGYVAPSALVSSQALPYRPNRGLHVTLTRYEEPHGAETHAAFAHEDRAVIPALLGVDGVAGAYTFSLVEQQRSRTLVPGGRQDAAGSLRVRLVYLDEEPVETASRIAAVEADLGTPGAGEVLLSTPVSTIVPWQDW